MVSRATARPQITAANDEGLLAQPGETPLRSLRLCANTLLNSAPPRLRVSQFTFASSRLRVNQPSAPKLQAAS